jgi:uncharacterized RDD family membrane protein YckC
MEYASVGAPSQATETQQSRAVYQRSLFREQVTAIPVLHGVETGESARPPRPSRPRTARRVHADQQALDFGSPRVRTALEAVIYCDAPVAAPVHRALALALDTSIILMALSVFVVTFQLAGGQVILNAHTVPLFAGIFVVFAFFYHFLFAIGNGDTPGMCWTQLRLLNFDGQRPDRDQRCYRLAAKCLSFLAAGLGVLWALVDEEKLSWHDHISRTFPSPQQY